MAVLTVSGQIGTGAREIGRAVAQRLQIDYIDQEILVEAARELGVSMESVVSLDERTAGLGERIAGMLRRFLETSAAAGASDPMLGAGGLDVMLGRTYAEAAAGEGLQEVSPERYLARLTGIIRDLAAHDDVLIIGRGSQMILADWPGAFHVLLTAPLDHRIEFIAARDALSRDSAAKRVHDGDRGRADFHHKFFKMHVDAPWYYHLTINTARFSLEECADLIADAARRAPPPPKPSHSST
jgi:cytidylate kinase